MTLSNKMTVLRGIASIAFIPMIMQDHQLTRVFALLIFSVAAITDYYDGRLARMAKEQTDFGVIADPIADKILTSVGFIAVSILQPDIVPVWMTVIIIFRELAITAWRFRLLARGKVLAADKLGKWKTGFQMTVIPYSLIVASIFSDEIGREWQSAVRATIFGDVIYGVGHLLAWIAFVLTVWSGIMYVRAECRKKPA